MKNQIVKHHNHTHFFIVDGLLYESYKTIRGPRCSAIAPVDDENLIVANCDDGKANEIYGAYTETRN